MAIAPCNFPLKSVLKLHEVAAPMVLRVISCSVMASVFDWSLEGASVSDWLSASMPKLAAEMVVVGLKFAFCRMVASVSGLRSISPPSGR